MLSPAGQAHCWGYNGTNEPLVAFRSIEVTATAVCGIRESDSQVQCWGGTTSEVTWPDTNTYVEPVAELVSADRSFCALQQDGALQCWGAYGDLGLPCCNSGASKTLAGPYVKLRGSTNYYCAQRDTGAWECFGVNNYGETQVPAGETFVELGPGGNHNCGIRPDGTVHCFGVATVNADASADFGQTRPPSEVEDVFGAIASGTNTSCGIRIDGRFECWGRYTDNDPQGSNRSLEPPGVCGDGGARPIGSV